MPTIPTRTRTSEEAVFLSEDIVDGAVVAYMNGVGGDHGKESRTNMNTATNYRRVSKRQVFHELIERRHGTSINPPKPKVQQLESAKVEFEYSEYVEFDKNDDQAFHEVPDTEDTILLKEIIDYRKDD
jgi:hypothetical protein